MSVTIGIAANTEKNTNGQTITSVPVEYSNSLLRVGAVPLVLPLTTDEAAIASMLSRVDGLVLPGGLDMDAGFFNQEMHPACNASDPDLDTFQISLVKLAVAGRMPVLGICRGAQVINVVLGGSLIQDIPSMVPESSLRHMQKGLSYDTDHEVRFAEGSRFHRLFGPSIRINSRHHQSIDTPGDGVRITAWATDGVVEGAQHESLPMDLVQWHPELLMQNGDVMLPLFEHFIDTCKKRR